MNDHSFDCRLRLSEKIFAWLFLPFFAAGAGFVVSFIYVLPERSGVQLRDIHLNLMVYLPSLLLVLVVMRRFLRSSFDALAENLSRTLGSVLIGYGVMIALSMVVNSITSAVLGFMPEDNPNQSAIVQQSIQDYSKMLSITVFMAPVVEECLFRGAVFGPIREKSRWLAWVVTIALFSFYHLWSSFVWEYEPILWLYLLDYVPAGAALCLCYEKSGTIWGPIFLHMLTNGIAMWAQRVLM